MKSAKEKIRKTVAIYAKLHKSEHDIVVEMVKAKRDMNPDDFARLEGSGDSRALFEISETLHDMLIAALAIEELVWFKSGVKGDPNQGGRWFAKAFPMFALVRKI